MRAFRFLVLNFVLIFCLIIGITISKAEAFTYYGEFRWEVTESGDPELSVITLGIADMGGGHLILGGGDEDGNGAMVGSGVVIGSNIMLILHDAWGDNDEETSATLRVILSLNSLDGTYHELWNDYDKDSKQMSTGYDSGTFKFLGPK